MKIIASLASASLAIGGLTAAPATGQTAARPSFNCAKAAAGAERTICGDPELARLDRIVGDLFAEARSLTLNAMQTDNLVSEQRAWVAQRNRCASVQCLRTAHFGRIAQLAGQLPTE